LEGQLFITAPPKIVVPLPKNMDFFKRLKLDNLLLPLVGITFFLILWQIIAGHSVVTKKPDEFG
jgi:hypothetical protein